MASTRIYFTIILLLVCAWVYLSNKCLNLSNSFILFSYFDNSKHFRSIPSIVVHSTREFSEIKEKCQFPIQPGNISIHWDNKWQKFEKYPLFIYSAYKDNRKLDNKCIRITALSEGTFSKRVFCKIWFRNHEPSVVEAKVDELWISVWDYANPNEYFRPLLLSCPFAKRFKPIAVSLISKPCQKSNNVFWFNSTKSSGKRKNFVVCLKPLNFQINFSLKLLEWLELQFILGADRIAIYKYHLHPRTFEVLKSYEKSKLVTIIDHSLPGNNSMKFDKLENLSSRDIWQKRRHEMLVYNDCFYRHIDSYKYVINLDLDEAIIPLKHNSWMELLNYVRNKTSRIFPSASISVPNVYFFDGFGDKSNSPVPKYFHMLRHLWRSANFTPPGFAQKSFFPTQYALTVSNHYALRSLYSGMRTNTVINKNLAQMHHYRASCPPKMKKECEENYMKFRAKDTTLLRFKERLIEKVSSKIKELNLTDSFINY
ncbi:glycosyltransferase family 92 protein [Trichonephila clavata]|uniref:Glycosyltransferase family 92 protein n=1 Tax=Trichonephila clavata TaxID=2740835 RepID=A0A8X6JCJ6_TRICU|nr:glycosyltransferase family 92 protein [Trichonephila clavata]